MHAQSDQKKRLAAVLMLFLTAVLWSLAGILIKYIDWNPLAIVSSRSIIAAIVIYPIFIRGKKLRFTKPLIFGAIAYSATVITFVSATKLTTAANAIVLQYTAPIYVAIFSYLLLREKITAIDWISIAIILAGMCLFFFDELTPGNMLGNLLAILSGAAFGFMAIFLRMQKHAAPIESIFWGNVLTALVGIPFITGPFPDSKGFAALVLLGVVQLTIPYILFSIAIKHVSALESLLIPIIEPLLNPVWVFLFIQETPGPWAFAGGALVLISVIGRGYIQYRASLRAQLPSDASL